MQVARSVATDHKDLIHDVAYDFYGKRMATCSADNFVKIWDLIDGQWKCTASWKSHYGAAYRVDWAHPEFGQVILTCGFDRTTAVWEELPSPDDASQEMKWIKRGNIVDSKSLIVDAKFGPKHLGFKLAMCAVDGSVNIYESPDVMNLSQWTLQHDFNISAKAADRVSASCISWSHSRLHPPTIAVGSDDQSQHSIGRVQIFEYNEPKRAWINTECIQTITSPVRDVAFSPNLGRSYHLLAVASRDISIFHIKPLPNSDPTAASKYEMRSVAQFNDHNSQVWRLSWNVTGTILASSGDDGCVRLWKGNYNGKWRCIAELRGDPTDPIHARAAALLQQPQPERTVYVQHSHHRTTAAAAAAGSRSNRSTAQQSITGSNQFSTSTAAGASAGTQLTHIY